MSSKTETSAADLPSGTVTFLFTDIEGSTKLLHQLGESYVTLLADHHRLLRELFAKWNGREVGTEGDSFFVSFPRATDAVSATVEAQRALTKHEWPGEATVKVRMGLHTGEPWTGSEGYVGMDVHRAARIAKVGYGGQVLLSETTTSLVIDQLPEDVSLLDLGHHGLKDMKRPEHIRQLMIEGLPADFPPLKTLGLAPSPQVPFPDAPELPAFLEDGAAAPLRPLFVGRQRQVSWLLDHLERLIDGQSAGNVLFVAGEAGMGKTSLLQAFADRAAEKIPSLLVAWGVCNAFIGSGDAYQPFRQALGMLSGDIEGAWRAGAITTEQARRLWVAFPDFGQIVVDRGRAVVATLIDGRGLLHRARASFPPGVPWLTRLESTVKQAESIASGLSQDNLYQACSDLHRAIAEKRPLLLLLDDLQWADAASLNLLFHLNRSLAGNPVLTVGAYRPEEVALGRDGDQHPLESIVAEVRRLTDDVVLNLGREETREKRAFVDALLDSEPNALDETFRQALFGHTGGQPLFTVEMLRYLQDRGDLVQDAGGAWTTDPGLAWDILPDRVEGVIEARIGRLEDELRELLNVAAVEGENFTAQVIARVQEINARALLRTLSRQLEKKHQLIRERSALKQGRLLLYRYRFTHALFQQYLYNDLSLGERQMLHAEIAAVLEELYTGRTDEIAVQLGRHFVAAGDGSKAVPYLIATGDRARLLYAHEEAIEAYERALEYSRTTDQPGRTARILMKLGQVHHSSFQFERSHQAYEESFALRRQLKFDDSGLELPPAGSLRVVWAEPRTLVPGFFRDNIELAISEQLFSGLVEFTLELDVVPAVAKRWDISDDGTRYRFYLEKDAVWSDGQPVTAGDFVYSCRRILESSSLAHLFYDIEGAQDYCQGVLEDPDCLGIQAIADKILQVELEGPASYILQVLTYLFPWPRHAIETHGPEWSNPENIVTNGPFLLKEWIPSQAMILSRNPRFHGRFPGNVNSVKVVLDETNIGSILNGYLRAEFDIVSSHSGFGVDHERLIRQLADEYMVSYALGTVYISFDWRVPPFDDAKVRRAFALALDKEYLTNVVLGGRVTPALGGLVPPGMAGHISSIGAIFDPAKARKLMSEAGYPKGQGFPNIRLAYVGPEDNPLPLDLRRQWQKHVNIEIDLESQSLDNYHRRITESVPHILISGWSPFYPDPDDFLRVLLTSKGPGVSGWQDERYISILKKARRLSDHGERMALYKQAEKCLVEDTPVIPLFYYRDHQLTKPWVRRGPYSPLKNWHWKEVILDSH